MSDIVVSAYDTDLSIVGLHHAVHQVHTSAQAVQERLHQMINDHLHGAGTSSAISPNVSLPGVCTALTLIHSIEEVVPGFMLSNFLPHMVRLLGRLAGENSNIQGLLLARRGEPVLRGAPR